MIDVDAEINSASRCDQNDTIIMIVRLLCNKLSIITNKGGILVWRLWGAGGCPGNPSILCSQSVCDTIILAELFDTTYQQKALARLL
jgi:hypothetical protein